MVLLHQSGIQPRVELDGARMYDQLGVACFYGAMWEYHATAATSADHEALAAVERSARALDAAMSRLVAGETPAFLAFSKAHMAHKGNRHDPFQTPSAQWTLDAGPQIAAIANAARQQLHVDEKAAATSPARRKNSSGKAYLLCEALPVIFARHVCEPTWTPDSDTGSTSPFLRFARTVFLWDGRANLSDGAMMKLRERWQRQHGKRQI